MRASSGPTSHAGSTLITSDLDLVLVGIVEIDRGRPAARAPAGDRAAQDGDAVPFQIIDDAGEILLLDHQAEVVEIARRRLGAGLPGRGILQRKEIDDGVAVDAHRGKADLPLFEFLHALRLEAQHPGAEGERGIDILYIENDVVQLGNGYRLHICLLCRPRGYRRSDASVEEPQAYLWFSLPQVYRIGPERASRA